MANKIKIKIGTIGFLPFEINYNKIKKWKSDVLEKELPRRKEEDGRICFTGL